MTLVDTDDAVAEGDLVGALRRFTARNRRDPDPELERRLVRLRHDAFAQLDRRGGVETWPRSLPDPFPGLDGIPEVGVSELTSELIGGAITHHGSLLVRGFVPPDRTDALVEGIDRAFAAADANKAGMPVAETAPWYVPFKPGPDFNVGAARGWVRQGGGLWTVDSPRMMFELTETFEAVGLRDLLAGYLGEAPVMSVKKGTLRRVPVDTGTDWHQDGSFLGEGIRTINVWMALTHCGDDAPGLDVVPRRLPSVVETGTEGALFDWSVGPGVVERIMGGEQTARPIVEAGDVMLFDELNLHRTGVSPGMTKPRYAIETWFFAPSHYPLDQVPVLF